MIPPRKRRAGEKEKRCRRRRRLRLPQQPPLRRTRNSYFKMKLPPQCLNLPQNEEEEYLVWLKVHCIESQKPWHVQGASFRGWKEVTSMFNKDDEQQLLEKCKSPKFKGTNLRIKEDMKTEKKSGFWDSLVLKQNMQSKKPDEIEGWEPPQITLEDTATDLGDSSRDHLSWPGWEDETKGSTKYTNLTSSGNSSRWSIKSAGKLVSIRRQSKGNLTDNWEELE
ncbi:testis development-related protein isoform X1 [Sarcophilus harrisii]|uniref:testis development-related protein isoform X1 n=2 Tax=Sarcophilus harrisii TaxID=9305 RepID=UPI001301D74E|nr:testis development-related protein isoform X1 [Sarcophilus harrisii]XP_031807014.1 testis development-related protein isoform X1 [Sarcophilus harrisii]